MRLLGVKIARSIWLFPTVFLNPLGVARREVMKEFAVRYGFRRTPEEDPPTKDAPGVKWTSGVFDTKGGPRVIRALTIHEDGVVVDTISSTEDGDAFGEDAIRFVTEKAGGPMLDQIPHKKIYVSEVYVQYKGEPKFLAPSVSDLMPTLSKAMADETAKDALFMGIIFGLDQSKSQKPIFRFEREVNTKPSENRYFSYAPIPTAQHLAVLEVIEALA